jgi:hypothetical protein
MPFLALAREPRALAREKNLENFSKISAKCLLFAVNFATMAVMAAIAANTAGLGGFYEACNHNGRFLEVLAQQ